MESTQLNAGDQVSLNSKAVSRKKSRKFHQEWTGPYVVLRRLGNVNYHIKPVEGKGQTKVVHRNHLKRSQNDAKEGQTKTNGSHAERPIRDCLNNEPVITHHEREQLPIQRQK